MVCVCYVPPLEIKLNFTLYLPFSGDPTGTGVESVVCLSVEWSIMGKILEDRLLPFVTSTSGKYNRYHSCDHRPYWSDKTKKYLHKNRIQFP